MRIHTNMHTTAASQKEHKRMMTLLISTILMAIALALAIKTDALESAVANYRAGLLSRTRTIQCRQQCTMRACPAQTESTGNCQTCMTSCG